MSVDKNKLSILYFLDIFMFSIFIIVFVLEIYNVILRVFFNSGIPQSPEIAGYSLIIITFLGMVRGFKEDYHVQFDVFLKTKYKTWNKIIGKIAQTITSITMLIIFISSIRVTNNFYSSGLSGISVPWLPIWTVHIFIPIGFGLSLYYLIYYRLWRDR